MKAKQLTAPLVLLAAVLSLGSCSMARRVQTARSLTIESRVTQMPTVAELDVAPQRAGADTAWVVRPFKHAASLKAQQQELVARILASACADVLVEPRIAHESHRRWFRTDHYLKVSGYPARYKAFRTASTEDIEQLRAMRRAQQPAGIRPVETLRPQLRRPLAPKPSVAVSDPLAADDSRTRKFARKTGYRGFVDGGYYFDVDGMCDGYGFTTTHGYQFGGRFFAGVGVGIYRISAEQYSGYGSGSYYEDYYLVPVYAALRAYVLRSRLSPYVDLRAGYEFNDAEGKYLSGGVGVAFGRFDLGGEYVRIADLDSFRVRIGVSF